MASIPKSGYSYPNHVARAFLLELENLMGKNGVSAMLNLSGLRSWIDHYPADNLEKQVDFSDVVALQLALEEIYGVRAGRNMARRSAWPGLQGLLSDIGALDPLLALARQPQPPAERMAIAVASFAKAISLVSDQACQTRPEGTGVLLSSHPCPHCWGRQATEAICHTMLGALEELSSQVAGEVHWSVTETLCCATGAEECCFLVQPLSAG